MAAAEQDAVLHLSIESLDRSVTSLTRHVLVAAGTLLLLGGAILSGLGIFEFFDDGWFWPMAPYGGVVTITDVEIGCSARGNVREVCVRSAHGETILIAGEVCEQSDGSLRLVGDDESILLFRRAADVPVLLSSGTVRAWCGTSER